MDTSGQCICTDASDHPASKLGDFVLEDCTGMANPYPIYPASAHHTAYDFERLYVTEGFDMYYNVTLTNATYELIVDMAVANSSYNRAVMSIAVDRYASGTVYGADFYPNW